MLCSRCGYAEDIESRLLAGHPSVCLQHLVNAALKEVAAAEWEMQAMRDDDHHPDFETVWIPMRMSFVGAAVDLARALRCLDGGR